jgi:hypothetical protein
MKKAGPVLAIAFSCATIGLGATRPYWGTDAAGTREALTEASLTPTHVGQSYGDFKWYTCNQLYTAFEAKDKTGATVTGHYCSGYFSKPGQGQIEIDVKPGGPKS